MNNWRCLTIEYRSLHFSFSTMASGGAVAVGVFLLDAQDWMPARECEFPWYHLVKVWVWIDQEHCNRINDFPKCPIVCECVESAISIGVTIYSMRMRSIKRITHSRSTADICKYFEIKTYAWTGRRLAIIYSYLGVLAEHHIVFVIFIFFCPQCALIFKRQTYWPKTISSPYLEV